jgi:hypothetical protein
MTMALDIQLTAASSNMPAYFTDWKSDFHPVDENGAFNGVFGGGDQWWAGDPSTAADSSVIMNMDDYSYTPGTFDGDVTDLSLGHNLVHDVPNDKFVQDDELTITQHGGGYFPVTETFQEAIFSMSHGGHLEGGDFTFTIPGQDPVTMHFDGLYDYLAEQGTYQHGTSGNDVFEGFGGHDTFVFDQGSGADTVDSFSVGNDILDVAGWGAEDINDLTIGVVGNDTLIFSPDLQDNVTLAGVTTILNSSDFNFA